MNHQIHVLLALGRDAELARRRVESASNHRFSRPSVRELPRPVGPDALQERAW